MIEHGPDPKTNSRLATVIAAAKKVGFPKISIESAIARGQGLSPSGAALEFLTIEAMIPPSVAIIVECETDSKLRTLNDLRLIIKEAGGSVTPTQHLFDRKGKIVCENPEGVGEEEIFDRGVEAGATDVETLPDGSVIVSTESSETTSVAQILSESSALKIVSSNITWDPKEEMMVEVPNPEVLSSSLGMLSGIFCAIEPLIIIKTRSTKSQASRTYM